MARLLLPLLLTLALTGATREERLRERAADLQPGTAISIVMLKGPEVRGQFVSAETHGMRLTTFRDNHIVQVDVPYVEMSGFRKRAGSGRNRWLEGFAIFGGIVLVLGLAYAVASGGKAIIAFVLLTATLTVQAQDPARLKRKAVDAQIGALVEVVLRDGQKTRGVLLAVSHEGVEIRPGSQPPQRIPFGEMKDFRDKRGGHWVRNTLAGYGILVAGLMVATLARSASR